jgi:CBS domain containing-hemolysin-like protein
VWLATAALAAGTYLSALKLALVQSSRAALCSAMEESGRGRAAGWLARRYDAAVFAVSLLRMVARVAFFMLVLAQVVDLRAGAAALTWPDLFVSGLISVTLLWLFTSVLGGSVARHSGDRLVASGLGAIRVMTWTCFPVTWAVSFVDEAVRRLVGATPHTDEPQELLRSIEETHRGGGLDEESASMLENVVGFTSTDVAEIMTPRMDIQGLELADDLPTIGRFLARCGHSRIPVYRDSLDHIVGILYVKDLVRYLGRDTKDFRLEPLLRQPIFVPETKPVRELLGDFRRSEVHMAIVVDEYGGTEGLVTIEDVLEEIVGEIRDEHEGGDEAAPALHAVDERRAEVDGRYRVGDLNQRLGLDLPEDQDFDTIGGFVLAALGHVPAVGETFEAHGARFTALATAPTHVRKVGIELLSAPAEA